MINQSIREIAKNIQLLILDVDGVLTDGNIWFDADGEEYKCFHTQDGMGLRLLQDIGVTVAVISGRASKIVENRLQSLNVSEIHLGIDNKINCYQALLKKLNLSNEAAAYVGDDVPDLPVMQAVGLPIAVNNAVQEIKTISKWQTKKTGGSGAVREVCDLIVDAKK